MVRKSVFIATLVMPLVLSGCTNPAADKSKAVTTEAAPVAQQNGKGDRYSISPDTSNIAFVGSKVTGNHNGSFQKFSGDIDFRGQAEESQVTITIDMDSVTTDTPQLTNHLKTADFFDIAKFPRASFVSTEIKPGGDKGATHTVTGNLQLHGVTKSISFPATIAVSQETVTVDSTFSINRKDFGINYAGAADNLIRNDVVLTFHIRGKRSA
jgi:polyisoprenoid-binding protein YceI